MHELTLVFGAQGTTVRVEYGDTTAAADPAGAHTISRHFPQTYSQPLAHFLRATAKVPDAQIISEHPAIRYLEKIYQFSYYIHCFHAASYFLAAIWLT